MRISRNIRTRDPVNRRWAVNEGLAGWWLAIPGLSGGATWYDLLGINPGILSNMGNANNGWRTSSRPGGNAHVLFDGAAGFIDLTNMPNVFSDGMTVGCWVNFTNVTSGVFNTLMSQFTSDGGSGQFLLGAHITGQTFSFDQNAATEIDSVATLTDTTAWYHLAAVRSGSSGSWTIKLYLNGVIDSTTNTAANPDASAGSIAIGKISPAFSGATATWCHGNIDDVRIWTRPLNDTEVRMWYDDSRVGHPRSLNHLPFVPRQPAAVSSVVFRKTLSGIGGRVGTRQPVVFGGG